MVSQKPAKKLSRFFSEFNFRVGFELFYLPFSKWLERNPKNFSKRILLEFVEIRSQNNNFNLQSVSNYFISNSQNDGNVIRGIFRNVVHPNLSKIDHNTREFFNRLKLYSSISILRGVFIQGYVFFVFWN